MFSDLWKPTLFRCNLTFDIDSLLSSSGNYIFQMQFYFLYWSLVHIWLCAHVWLTLLCIYVASFFFWILVHFRVTCGILSGYFWYSLWLQYMFVLHLVLYCFVQPSQRDSFTPSLWSFLHFGSFICWFWLQLCVSIW